jgi:hypothetical protein
MNQAKQQPLSLNFRFAPQRKPVQAFVSADIPEYGFDH